MGPLLNNRVCRWAKEKDERMMSLAVRGVEAVEGGCCETFLRLGGCWVRKGCENLLLGLEEI